MSWDWYFYGYSESQMTWEYLNSFMLRVQIRVDMFIFNWQSKFKSSIIWQKGQWEWSPKTKSCRWVKFDCHFFVRFDMIGNMV